MSFVDGLTDPRPGVEVLVARQADASRVAFSTGWPPPPPTGAQRHGQDACYYHEMPRLIDAPTLVQAAGTPPKRIEEYAGLVNSGHASIGIARMMSPAGWREPGQRPSFEEITVVLRGTLRVEHPAAPWTCGLVRRS